MVARNGSSSVRKRKGHSTLPFHGENTYGSEQRVDRRTDQHGEIQFVFFLVVYLMVLAVVVFTSSLLPNVRSSKESTILMNQGEDDVFSEERARNYLIELSRIGPRPTGSYENEVLAVDYLLREIKQIQLRANKTTDMVIEVDLQKSSGSFYVNFEEGMTSVYRNVKNVVVKIGPKGSKKSLLVNCHFDSVPTSPGASDDAISCAVMLEVLNNLAQGKKPLRHSVIFLFNGAEENFLQASHGFVTQHKWAKSVGAFINLEACGAGGKEVLFQAGPGNPWIVEAYAKGAKHPFGSIIGQEVFQGGLIPSDTDFRIFRDFGKVPGLDFAYAKNGYVYHTRFDSPAYVNPGSIQHEGDNVLGVLREILRHPQFENPPEDQSGKLVYFDLMGLGMVSYTARTGLLINMGTVVLALVTIFASILGRHISLTIRELVIAELVIFLSLAASILSTLLVAILVDLLGVTLSWYSRSYWIVGLYGCPALLAMLLVHWIVSVKRKIPSELGVDAENIYFNAVIIFWCNNVIVMMMYNIHSAFMLSFWVFFPSVIQSFTKFMFGKTRKGDHLHRSLPYYGMQIFPLLVITYCWWQIFEVFVPIMGRIGGQTNPDLLIGIITAIAAFSSCSYMFPLVYTVKTVKKTALTLGTVAVATILIISTTKLGFPYSDDPQYPAPQRFWIKHVERNFYTQQGSLERADSGFWIVPLDHKGPEFLLDIIPEMRDAKLMNCDEKFYCGMPFYFPVIKKLSKLYYLPAPKPKISVQRMFKLVKKENLRGNKWRFTFNSKGTDHMGIILCPLPRVKLSQWSLTNGTATTEYYWQNRPVYMIYYSHGEESGVWDIWAEFTKNAVLLRTIMLCYLNLISFNTFPQFSQSWHRGIGLALLSGLHVSVHVHSHLATPSHPFKVPEDYSEGDAMVEVSFLTHNIHGHDSKTEPFISLLSKMPEWSHTIGWVATYDSYAY